MTHDEMRPIAFDILPKNIFRSVINEVGGVTLRRFIEDPQKILHDPRVVTTPNTFCSVAVTNGDVSFKLLGWGPYKLPKAEAIEVIELVEPGEI